MLVFYRLITAIQSGFSWRWWHILFFMCFMLALSVTCIPSLQRTLWCWKLLLKIPKPTWPNPLNTKECLSMKTKYLIINKDRKRKHCCFIGCMHSCPKLYMNESSKESGFLFDKTRQNVLTFSVSCKHFFPGSLNGG